MFLAWLPPRFHIITYKVVIILVICYNFSGDLMEINVDKLLEKTLSDEVVIFETDTVYGIGCLVSSKKGVKKLYKISITPTL